MFYRSLKQKNRKSGVSLVELLTVIAVFSVLSTMFYSVFISNFNAYQRRIAEADLWNEANQIIDTIRTEMLSADQLIITLVAGQHRVQDISIFRNNILIAQYFFDGTGFTNVGGQGIFSSASQNLDAQQSFLEFDPQQRDVMTIYLVLRRDHVAGGELEIRTSTEIFLREGMRVDVTQEL